MSRKIIALSLALACLLARRASSRSAATPQTNAAHHALDYVRTLQNADGGFPVFGSDSSAGATLDAILAFAAAGVDVGRRSRRAATRPSTTWRRRPPPTPPPPADAAKLVLGPVGGGRGPARLRRRRLRREDAVVLRRRDASLRRADVRPGALHAGAEEPRPVAASGHRRRSWSRSSWRTAAGSSATASAATRTPPRSPSRR